MLQCAGQLLYTDIEYNIISSFNLFSMLRCYAAHAGYRPGFPDDPQLIDYTKTALRIYCAGMFLFGIQIACQLTFTSIGNAPCSIIVAVVRKFILLIPLIYIIPGIGIMENKALDVYLAEPAADVIAVTFTAVLFYFQFRKALKRI